uniref:Uncharacterized protein n=1 Tax=Raoultella planticola TaxID=575 RepID=W8CTX6_RAOPL|nr:hypothetical protein pKpNDM1_00146 [Raoultella planticola]
MEGVEMRTTVRAESTARRFPSSLEMVSLIFAVIA